MILQSGRFREDTLQLAKDRLRELMWVITLHHSIERDDMVSAVIYAMALRQLSPRDVPGQFSPHIPSLHGRLNEIFEVPGEGYVDEASNLLLSMVKDEIARHGTAKPASKKNQNIARRLGRGKRK